MVGRGASQWGAKFFTALTKVKLGQTIDPTQRPPIWAGAADRGQKIT